MSTSAIYFHSSSLGLTTSLLGNNRNLICQREIQSSSKNITKQISLKIFDEFFLNRGNCSCCAEHSNDEKDKREKGYIGLVNMTSKVYDIVSEKVLGIFQKVLVLLNSIYTSFEKAFLSKENTNALDKTVASCMMLAVAVLLMVFLKRVPK